MLFDFCLWVGFRHAIDLFRVADLSEFGFEIDNNRFLG
jgi:hypothetical protein